ncbi:MAG: DUF3300 domain-containing protein [Opitutaceae bacterium]|nr:DUF3300 domain-containing protein [Opitutaceae bacterium]
MKTPLVACLSMACLAFADPAVDPEFTEPERLTREEIETLVGPIALYPDALVALILPAATRTADVVLAARFLNQGGDPTTLDAQPWEDSVRALARYPEVIKYLDENLAWTQRLGDCFIVQPVEVMDAIQAVRLRARQRGLLSDTDEQTVLVEEGEVRIVPTRSTVIYVPRYNVDYLYVSEYWNAGPFLTFGIGYGIGTWLSYDCDWRHHRVRVVHRPPEWTHRPDWRSRPHYRQIDRERNWRDWKPGKPHRRTHYTDQLPPGGYHAPNYAGTPPRPRYDSRPDPRPGERTHPQPRPRITNRDDDHRRPHDRGDRRPGGGTSAPRPTSTTPSPIVPTGPTSGNVSLSTPLTPPPARPVVAETRSHRTRAEPPAPRHSETIDRSDQQKESRDDSKPGRKQAHRFE